MRLEAIPAMLAMIPSVIRGVSTEDLERIKRIVRATFPGVRQIGVQTLANWFNEKNLNLLVIDVRSQKEYEVSHLRGAINLCRQSEIHRLIMERRPSHTVVYCSVGFRSSRIAAQLKHANEQVFNLEGSIFEWVNQGRPVYKGERQAHTVHPFEKRWAGLLKEGFASKTS
jgi:rhodanese-related sulfurtransferase